VIRVKKFESFGPQLTRREEVVGMVFGLWTILGLFLDGWAHSHEKPESFFTPWHGVLYSGFMAAALWAGWIAWRRRNPQRSLLETMPPGHLVSLAGFALFGVGAVGDLSWHEIFGVEADVEALLSPTHLLLLLGGAIALSAPVRRMMQSSARAVSAREFRPALLSLTLLTAVGAFFFGYVSPLGTTAVGFPNATTHTHDLSVITPEIGRELRENWALGSIFVTTLVFVIPALFVKRHWRTAPGTFLFLYTFLLLLQVGLGEFKQWPLIAIGLVVGAVVDASMQREAPAWLLGTLIPTSTWSTYFLVFELQNGVGWSPELWVGATLMAGVIGGLIGSLATGVTDLQRRTALPGV
jgi:hypothetical protein